MKQFGLTLLSAVVASTLTACGSDTKTETKTKTVTETITEERLYQNWYLDGQKSVSIASAQQRINTQGAAKNVILFVGDGMGISTVTAARILEGQMKGMSGEENSLSFEMLPYSGFAKTYNVDAQTPDSAGTMTAMVTGVKTDAGVLSIDSTVERSDCESGKGRELVTALELAEIAGKSTGIVSTARITHATPAATYAKSADRNWEDNSDMTDANAQGCTDIADQLINFEEYLEARFEGIDVDGIEVAMGGGRRHFLPKDVEFNVEKEKDAGAEGDRTDGRNLINEWKTKYANGAYVNGKTEFDAVDAEKTEKLFGLFNESHMRYEADRKNDTLGEPSIAEMTSKAIDVLDNNEKGYFLMVEAGRIDHGHHAGSAYNALTDTIAFSDAVKIALEKVDLSETLVIVTADHSHVFTIAGYPKRGNPILGKVVPIGSDEPSLAHDNMPYTTVGYMNGRGMRDFGNTISDADAIYDADAVAGRTDLTSVDTASSGFHQETPIPKSSETHAGEDVGIYAAGPGAHLISGTNEQSIIFHVMNHATNFTGLAEAVVAAK